MAEIILQPAINERIVIDGVPTPQFYTWLEQVSEAIKPPLTGSGSPESNVIASVGRWYVDTSASVGTGIYFKETGEGDTGWVQRS